MPRLDMLAILTIVGALIPPPARAEIAVVASIKPVHSLVAAVMEGVGTPDLIVHGNGSPHAYQMRPSEAAALQRATVVFWIGPDLEVFLEKPLASLSSEAQVVALSDATGLIKLPPREGGHFESQDHGDNDHDAHQDHDAHIDPHVWLDPVNGAVMVQAIAHALAVADPTHAPVYQSNATRMVETLASLTTELDTVLAAVRGRPFMVFHDAYQYFEARFDVLAAGSVTVSPDAMPGARRLREIREKASDLAVVCIFTEPQFTPRLVATVIEGSDIHRGVLDPLGADLKDGPALYPTLIRNMAWALKDCLAQPS